MSTNSSSSSEILQREMQETWQWRMDTDPEFAAAMGLLSTRRSSHALDPRSLESFEQRLQCMKAALHRAKSTVKREELSDQQEILSYDIYVQQLSDYIQYTPLHKSYLCCINRLEGPQTDLPLYARYLPLNTPPERQFYLAFLKAIPLQLQQVIELLKQGLEEKRTPPKISLDGVVPQIRGMVQDEKLQSFRAPLLQGERVFPGAEQNVLQSCLDELKDEGPVAKAFLGLAGFLEQEYIPNLRTEISAVKGYPDGSQYYQDCLKFHTTTSMTPQEVHQLGLDEVARIRSQMESIAADAGYEGRLAEYLEHLRTSPDYAPSSPEQLCTLFRDITGRIGPAMLKLFHLETLPRMPFVITETPAAQAPMAPAAYYLAGSAHKKAPRPGCFYVNTSELSTRRTYECEALALHEATPGHHTQAAIQAENPDLPAFRQNAEDRRYFEAPCRFPFYTGCEYI